MRLSGPWNSVGRVFPRHGHRGRPLNWVVRWHVDASRLVWIVLIVLGVVAAIGLALVRTNEAEIARLSMAFPGAGLFRHRGARMFGAVLALVIAGVGICGYFQIIG